VCVCVREREGGGCVCVCEREGGGCVCVCVHSRIGWVMSFKIPCWSKIDSKLA